MPEIDRPMKRLLLFVALGACLAGCAKTEPFYYNLNEFNRSLPTFAKGPPVLEEVGVCYAKSSTTADAVRDMAVSRCAAYGKQAVFRSQDVLNCPMTAPVRAMYDCVTQ